ncbi:replication protein A 32 kDa subunit-like isoform X1 [Gouania willdenowi]|uniref:replication protein A 32 kDa subunit-like isoform X1 n=1 Tax=Gouania willdenowi TaxID=441366 RepID=UPI001054E41D|nr:replication protein A 32 kDa subunit-like isoform X1 [Gouania willdenowi]
MDHCCFYTGRSSAATNPKPPAKAAALAVLPCTVSQLLSASQSGHDTFTVCHWDINQVSVVGAVRGFSSFFTSVLYSVDDMTAPPLPVKQWLSSEDMKQMSVTPTGAYVKVVGSLRQVSGKIMLVAMHIRCVKDLNEITSHMMEVVQAQMYLSGKMVDVNMNTIPASLHDRYSYAHLETSVLDSFSSAQNQVMDVIRRYSINPHGIGSDKLKTNLDDLSMEDIRKALTFLLSEGHVFSTIDENHFKC